MSTAAGTKMPSDERLTLSWFGKEKTLLRTQQGKYEWVERNDLRVDEVRLLHEIDAIGEGNGTLPGDNLVIVGDSYHALRALTRIPEYAKEYRGRIAQIYIDPPFNTGQAFTVYSDTLAHSVWLTMMRDRLRILHELLAPAGTIWVHLDSTEVHRCRCVMDDEFGHENYLATVIWQRTTAKSLARRTMGTMHEQILVYGASQSAELRPLFLPLEEEYQASRFSHEDSRGFYDTGDLTAGSYRPHLDSGQPWKGFDPSARRRCWAAPSSLLTELGLDADQISRLSMREKLDALDRAGYIHWPDKLDGFPRYKKYVHRIKGRLLGDLWTDIKVINSQAIEQTGFPTQKPEALLRRILQMGSQPGDIVLDCFAGSGTTAAVAQKMGRRWVIVELEADTVGAYVQPRLSRVVRGVDPGGITKAVSWIGGGQFRILNIGDSIYEEIDGHLFISERITNGAFAMAVCPQLGFSAASDPPFVGRKGKSRLAVLDGVADVETVRAVVARLNVGESVVVVAKAVTREAEKLLTQLSSGSRLEKVPSGLLGQNVCR
jgi:adenine-specific DNA-methyltransferase